MDKKDLDYYLQEVNVLWDFPDSNPIAEGWCAVSNEEGIIAYFGNEVDAFRFRLDYINRKLNP